MAPGESEGNRSDSRSTILHAALQLFSAHGFDGTSIDDIRQAAGFKSKASLYTHFKSKEEVALALIRQILEEVNRVVMQAYGAARSEPLFQFIAVGCAFINWGLNNPQEYAFCFIRVQQDLLIEGKAAYREGGQQLLGQMMAQFIHTLRATMPIRPIADSALISMMLGLINRAVIDQASFGAIDQETKVQQIFEMCMGMLFSEPVSLT